MKKSKIIKIISEYDVIINSGTLDGVAEGDIFRIVDPDPRFIEDIDTGEILDKFQGYKDYVIVKEVKEKYSICSSRTVYQPGESELGLKYIQSSISSIVGKTGRDTKQPLNVSEYDIDDIFSEYTGSIISVGDVVEKK